MLNRGFRTKRTLHLIGCLAVATALGLALAGCASDDDSFYEPDPTPTATPTPADRRYLFLLYSDAGELIANDDGTYLFRLTQVWDSVVAFTDRPFRDAVSAPLHEWIGGWAANGFVENPPNAAITMLVDGQVQNTDWAVMTLRNPRFTSDGALEFDSEFLRLPNGQTAFFPTVLGSGVKPSFSTTQVFIDSTGAVLAPPDQLSWVVNGRSELMLNVSTSGYIPAVGETLVLDDPDSRFCTGSNVRPTVQLALPSSQCAGGDCTVPIGDAVTSTQIPIVRVPGASAGTTAALTITTYEACDPARPITLTLANAVHYQALGETPAPTPTSTPTAAPGGTRTPCSIEAELKISAANGWLPLSDPNCITAGVAEVGSAKCPKAWIDGGQARDFGTDGLTTIHVHGDGVLAVEDNFGSDPLHLSRIVIGTEAGESTGASPKLIIGTATCPIQKSVVTLSFRGDPDSPTSVDYLRNKGIIAGEGAQLILHGAAGVVPTGTEIADSKGTASWTYLAAPAGPEKWTKLNSGIAVPVPPEAPGTTLRLAKDVDWNPGDWIVVASTDFAEDHQEIVQIAAIEHDARKDVAVVTLNSDTPLKHYHFGGPAPSSEAISAGLTRCNKVPLGDVDATGLPGSFCDGPDQNFGVDERAEVGLLSRNIKLTATLSEANPHYGGQIRVETGVHTAQIEGVELENFGQAIKDDAFHSGYPIHFHHVGDVPDRTVLNSNSIHHSYNKCVVVHATNGLRVEHNVCTRNIGHSFYLETGTEERNTFYGNLAAGAMAPGFVPGEPDAMWPGDYLARGSASTAPNGYDGINVNPTSLTDHGEVTAPTGFWIAHPNNTYQHNSVSGCQLQGRGYWILPQTPAGTDSPFPPNGFDHNRVHGCYGGIDSGADGGATSPGGFAPVVVDKGVKRDVVATLTNVTVTRIRNKGIWLRPGWYHVDGARVATTRDGISLVSAGGVEGSPPGEWALLTNSVLVGISNNNPERFGPCPSRLGGSCYGEGASGGNGFPNAHWNVAGFMFYDGPARLDTVRFVNFNVDIAGYLTAEDRQVLATAPARYEGDAALGWFQSNVNNYPPTQYTKNLVWENTDFRHQVYTEEVNLSDFVDGDKNTVILDRDGTLSGFVVVDENGETIAGRYPISLNNLAFNAIAPASGPLTVDECGALGALDAIKENRPTALMSPEAYATLEFTAWDPTLLTEAGDMPTKEEALRRQLEKKAPLTFIKDQQDYTEYPGASGFEPWSPHHYGMTLVGRNITQVREPKVMRGAGYTVHSFKSDVAVGAYNGTPILAKPHALPRFVSAVLSDVVSGKTTTLEDGREVFVKPFRTRIGLCYKSAGGYVPRSAASFKVERGRISLGGEIGSANPDAYKKIEACNNFMFQDGRNFRSDADADPTTLAPTCPASSAPLEPAPDWETFEANKDGYYYDAAKGMLFLYLEQDEPNATGAAPIGTCTKDSTDVACQEGQDFYSCPKDGCFLYTVRVVDDAYKPLTGGYGVTTCENVYQGDQNPGTHDRDYTDSYPPNGTLDAPMDRLAYVDGTLVTGITAKSQNPAPDSLNGNFPHAFLVDGDSAICPIHRTGPNNMTPVPSQGTFSIGLYSGSPPYTLKTVTFVAMDDGTVVSSSVPSVTLGLDDRVWNVTIEANVNGAVRTCTAVIKTAGSATAPTWTLIGSTQCQMPPNGDKTIPTGPF